MSSLPDPIRDGLARWQVAGGEHGALPERLTVDVAIIGSGAGGGVTAEMLSKAGLKVLLIEEGPLKTSSDLNDRTAHVNITYTRWSFIISDVITAMSQCSTFSPTAHISSI